MLTRRSFVRTVGIGAAGALTGSFIGARGREHSLWSAIEPGLQAVEPGVICLASNENPLGPGPTVLDAARAAFGPDGSKPGRYAGTAGALIEAIARKLQVKTENIVLGCGSTQILRSATHLFTAKDRPLVGTIPTYEECAGYAELVQHPVNGVPLDAEFRMDLDRMADAARGAGLLFYCNPNNPTATYVGAKATREFIARVNRESPETTILVDEAYYDYVTDPDHDTHIPIAVENPRVLVARTFSKAYGMAGLRIGYAVGHRDTIRRMEEWDGGSGGSSLNVIAMHAAIAAIERPAAELAAERERNRVVRDLTMKWFADRGMKPAASQANFMFVNVGRPVRQFREACRGKRILVARDFPPFEKTHCRISFGTMEEMKAAFAIFTDVLGSPATAEAA
ncbi:MAG TPA: aminotransferase class I/II-fold pyridoxal phosphate-dependent enzyme [Vicinamibacterales bacterium]|nr:aminotransferase class I/II-fold pyridoxal phosphate-dependent enzyme [Vicinamibacterales bacterium]